MKTKFNIDKQFANTVVYVWLFYFIFMSLIAIIPPSTISRIILPVIISAPFIFLIWVGLRYGTYITIDYNKSIYNTFFFIKRNVILFSNVTCLSIGKSFMGLVVGIEITYYKKNGKTVTVGLMGKQIMKKEELKRLIETIHNANPNIVIAKELL